MEYYSNLYKGYHGNNAVEFGSSFGATVQNAISYERFLYNRVAIIMSASRLQVFFKADYMDVKLG